MMEKQYKTELNHRDTEARRLKRIFSVPLCLRGLLLMIVVGWIACAGRHYQFPMEQMRMPPGGLSSAQVPMFVSFGTDDNPYSDGLNYLTELFASRKNPARSGNAATFDGLPLHYSFYVNTIYITPEGKEDPESVKRSWKVALEHGHEIGVHTHSHPHGEDFSVKEWQGEIDLCIDHLTRSDGLGVPRNQLIGFRTPFLEYSDRTLTAVYQTPFTYDCSLEQGDQKDQDGRNFVWPYLLDHGSPGEHKIHEHPGLWELPVYHFIVPPDELCERYGVPRGLRAGLKKRNDYFDVKQGKITGMDWNLWFEYGMDKAEFLATLKYNLDLRLQGNRCPLNVGMHSWIYADRNPENPPKTTVQERRDAFREFLEYALSKPEVRVVSSKELLAWIQSPVPLSPSVTDASRASTDTRPAQEPLGAGFRCSIYSKRVDPGPEYWTLVGREMAARFPGARPEAIWIVGRINGNGTQLPFPVPDDVGDPLITGSNEQDRGEAALNLFDELGFRVWLQVEPRFASAEKLLNLVLKRYSHHPSVIGVGIDVEWNKSIDPDGGEPVSDAEASAWLALARSYNLSYRLFLKHWLPEKMPPTVRDGILFVDDSQVFPTMDPMIDEFAQWGKAFAPSPVAFQIGYPSDRPWWHQLSDPPKDIGMRILKVVPNTQAIFWVDFSVLEVFPPQTASE